MSIKVVAGAVKNGAREKRTRTRWLEAIDYLDIH